MRPPKPQGPPPSILVLDSRWNPVDPSRPRKPYFTSRDRNVPRGMEDRAVPRYGHPDDFLLLAPAHVSYFLPGWEETQNGVRLY